ncbi:MAG: HEAT repeat domain-containing protein [Planctomycetes bacterium]|nr:HEAT repeat domain-containing protein [Planctomycetota bacterium]
MKTRPDNGRLGSRTWWFLVPLAGAAVLFLLYRGSLRQEEDGPAGPVGKTRSVPDGAPTASGEGSLGSPAPSEETPGETPFQRHLAFGYLPGQELSYRASMRSEVTLSNGGGEPTRIEMSIEGLLVLRVYEAGTLRFGLGLELRSAALRAGRGLVAEGSPAELESQLAREIFVQLSPLGRVEAWYFPRDLPAMARNILGAFLLPAFFVLPEGESESWTREENDLLGAYVATYRLGTGTRNLVPISRAKRYTGLYCGADVLAVQAGAGIDVAADGEIVARFDRANGRWASIDGRETVRVRGDAWGMDLEIDGSSECSIQLASEATRQDPSGASFLDRIRSASCEAFTELLPGALEPDSLPLERRFPDASIEEVLSRARERVQEGSWAGESSLYLHDLVALFLADPRAVEQALDLLGRSTGGEEMQVLAMALAWSGSEAGQAGLAALAADCALRPEVRQKALEGLGFVRGASAETIEILRETAAGKDAELARSAYQSLGLVGSSFGGAAGRDAAGEALAASEPTDPGLLPAWITAMGNAAPAGGLEPLLQHARREDIESRAGAVYALRGYADLRARRAVADAARDDPAVDVRVAAVEALSASPGQSAVEILESVLDEDTEPSVRMEALSALASRARASGRARDAVRRALEDADPGIRDRARSALDSGE